MSALIRFLFDWLWFAVQNRSDGKLAVKYAHEQWSRDLVGVSALQQAQRAELDRAA